jgi:hypothetical protein
MAHRLVVVVIHPLCVHRLGRFPTRHPGEEMVSEPPLEIDYVEYAAVDCVCAGQRDGCA